MLHNHCCSRNFWKLTGLLRDNDGQKSTKQSYDALASVFGNFRFGYSDYSSTFGHRCVFVRGTWVHGEVFFCEISSTMFVTTVPTSIWTLLAISVERYKSLSDPLNRFRRSPFMSRKRALIINFLIWLYSVLFASIP